MHKYNQLQSLDLNILLCTQDVDDVFLSGIFEDREACLKDLNHVISRLENQIPLSDVDEVKKMHNEAVIRNKLILRAYKTDQQKLKKEIANFAAKNKNQNSPYAIRTKNTRVRI